MKVKITSIVVLKKIETLKDIQDLKARAGRIVDARMEAAAVEVNITSNAKRTRKIEDFAPLATETPQDGYDVHVARELTKLAKLGVNVLAMLAAAASVAPVASVKADKVAA